MAKQVSGQAKFQVPGGQATPAPPVGTSLGKFGINLGQFVQQFNDRTKEYNGTPIPVIVTVYGDRTFDFVTKSPPAAALLKEAAGIVKGSGVPNKALFSILVQIILVVFLLSSRHKSFSSLIKLTSLELTNYFWHLPSTAYLNSF